MKPAVGDQSAWRFFMLGSACGGPGMMVCLFDKNFDTFARY
jgi:hypothetical protein